MILYPIFSFLEFKSIRQAHFVFRISIQFIHANINDHVCILLVSGYISYDTFSIFENLYFALW
jgi:hypothetical protein